MIKAENLAMQNTPALSFALEDNLTHGLVAPMEWARRRCCA